jgi:bifunctional DNA-binding transcriptional regulator/antitoxin component of YhaV-PrlF toxin-antitoxin module
MTCLTSGPHGEIVLPENLRTRHGIAGDTPIRVIETRNGILLVPLTNEPMSPGLAKELAEWQSLASASWETFDYVDDAR